MIEHSAYVGLDVHKDTITVDIVSYDRRMFALTKRGWRRRILARYSIPPKLWEETITAVPSLC